MVTRKDEKERRRLERLEAERREASAARTRLLLGYMAAALIAAVVVVGIVVAIIGGGGGGIERGDVPEGAHVDLGSGEPPQGVEFDGREGTAPPPLEQADLAKAARAAGCTLGLDLPDEGANHLPPGEEPPKYGTNPPTSGNHNQVPAADGAYLEPVPPANFLHSFEHGRMAVLYDPELPERDQLELKGVFDEDPAGMLLTPYPQMPHSVAVAAWTNMVTCERYGDAVLDVVRDFRDTFRGQGPEATPL